MKLEAHVGEILIRGLECETTPK